MIFLGLYVVWAIGCVAVYGSVYWNARRERKRYRDQRSDHEYYVATGFLLVSLSVLLSIVLAIVEAGTLFRLGFSALALGAFLGAGIVMRLELPRRKR